MIALSIAILLCLCLVCSIAQVLPKEALLSTPELVAAAGYPVERHRVTTDDGYILQAHRIPAGKRAARKSSLDSPKMKKAILIGHGLLGSSGDFVIMGPERSLAYLLADAGYDVWLANFRGTVYSSHENYTKNDCRFWEFSFHEHGKYDLPATIDKVLEVTGLPEILYIGYSMGTTTFFTMMSQRPEYNEKLIAFFALAPAVYLDSIKGLASVLLKTVDFPGTARNQGMISFSVKRDLLDMATNLCSAREAQNDICMQLIYAVVGADYEQYDPEMTPVIIARAQPASWRQFEHFGKIAITGVFTSWEDGLWGAVKPYNFSKIDIPVSILYGENDMLTHKSGVKKLARELREIGVLEEMKPACKWPKFNHLDFTFAKDVGNIFNKPFIDKVHYVYNKYSKT
ncbi:lipase 1-like [Aricia agestis]|uniref:lipase 1-like n=1 Tax=Aricia agestis TaxID=91739 RepID=UPI001C2030E4|nr:lipase 1-like [Aricia agestis]